MLLVKADLFTLDCLFGFEFALVCLWFGCLISWFVFVVAGGLKLVGFLW